MRMMLLVLSGKGSPRRHALGGGYYAWRRGKLYAATGNVMTFEEGGIMILVGHFEDRMRN